MVGRARFSSSTTSRQTRRGVVSFHPDPSQPDLHPRVLVERALPPDVPYVPQHDASACDEFENKRPALDGEAVLVAEEPGPLLRIALPSGERSTLVERDGRRSKLATDVSSFTVPHHGTDHERNEVIYFVATGDDRGMWRWALP